MNRLLVYGILIVALYSCRDNSCTINELNYVVKDQTGNEIAHLSGQVCPTDKVETTPVSPEFIARIYFREIAELNHLDVYTAFEQGIPKVMPLEIVEQHTDHIIEIINKNDLSNNFNNPYPIDISDFELEGPEDGSTKNGNATIELNGHPLQLILSLTDINDEGGAKKWKFNFATEALTGDTINLNDSQWVCFFDNDYTFLKGNRFKYDPNNTGCNEELDKFPNKEPQVVFGKYSITTGDKPAIKLEITSGTSSTIEESFIVEEWDPNNWDQIKVRATYNGTEVIATLVKKETVEWSEF